jgi:hypothetical protein
MTTGATRSSTRAGEDRRQGAVHQGTRDGHVRGPRRHCGALDEGRAGGPARWLRDHCRAGARGSARRAGVRRVPEHRGHPGRQHCRHVQPARQAQLQHARPDLLVEPVRGNVETRLRKLDQGSFAAILLAAAGLKRLGLERRIAGFLPYEVSLPAVGQGASAWSACPATPRPRNCWRHSRTATRGAA